MLTAPKVRPVRWSMRHGTPTPTAATSSSSSSSIAAAMPSTSSSCDSSGVWCSRRWFAIALGLVLRWVTARTLAGYFTFRDGGKAANGRLPEHVRSQLKEQGGLLLTHPTTILLLGTDTGPGREGIRHSDSVMLV